jgi:hypothetical protein
MAKCLLLEPINVGLTGYVRILELIEGEDNWVVLGDGDI